MSAKVGRNDPCPCGSGKKYKKCCEAKQRKKFEATLLSGNPEASKTNKLFGRISQPQGPSPESLSDRKVSKDKVIRNQEVQPLDLI